MIESVVKHSRETSRMRRGEVPQPLGADALDEGSMVRSCGLTGPEVARISSWPCAAVASASSVQAPSVDRWTAVGDMGAAFLWILIVRVGEASDRVVPREPLTEKGSATRRRRSGGARASRARAPRSSEARPARQRTRAPAPLRRPPLLARRRPDS